MYKLFLAFIFLCSLTPALGVDSTDKTAWLICYNSRTISNGAEDVDGNNIPDSIQIKLWVNVAHK